MTWRQPVHKAQSGRRVWVEWRVVVPLEAIHIAGKVSLWGKSWGQYVLQKVLKHLIRNSWWCSHWPWIFVSPVFRSEKGTWNVRKRHQTHPRLGAERGVQGAVVYVRVTHRGFLYFFFPWGYISHFSTNFRASIHLRITYPCIDFLLLISVKLKCMVS